MAPIRASTCSLKAGRIEAPYHQTSLFLLGVMLMNAEKDEGTFGLPEPVGQSANSEGYKVGYGKPPKHTQFPKGNGPGKGRPKGAKNLKTIVNTATAAKVATKINGTVKQMSKLELAVHQLSNKAAAGDLKAIEKLIALQERYGPEEHSVAPSSEETKADLATLQNYLAMLKFGEDPSTSEQGNDGN